MSPHSISIVSGSCDITPERPFPLFGYGHRSGLAEGTDSRIECNAVLLVQGDLRVILLQIDSLFPSRLLQDTLTSRLPESSELLIVASHTHFAPALDPGKPLLGKFDQAYFDFAVDRIGQLIGRLLNDTPEEASILKLERNCAAGIYRRKRWVTITKSPPFIGTTAALLPNFSELIDQKLTTIGLFNSAGELIALLWNFACHPTASPHTNQVGSDYVGFVRDQVRKQIQRDLPVLFLPGAMGDIRPRIISRSPSLGQRLRYPFSSACFAVPTTSEQYTTFCREVLAAVPVDQMTSDAADPLTGRLSVERSHCPLDRILSGDSTEFRNIPLAQLSIGDALNLILIGAEPSNRYVGTLHNQLGQSALVVGYFEDVYGYLPTENQIPEGGYEVNGFQKWFSVEGEFKAGFEQRFLECLEHRSEVFAGAGAQ